MLHSVQIIEVTGFGVRSAVLRLRRRDSPLRFTIYPMIHMARPGFYADVAARLRTADLIVAEGIASGARGRPSVLLAALTLSYRILRFNSRSGLVEENIDYEALGVPVVCPDVDADELRSAWRQIPWLDRLAVWCAMPMVLLARLVGGVSAIWSAALEVSDLPSEEEEALAARAPALADVFGGARDRRLIAALRQLHRERRSEAIEVAVVYGAGHVAAVVRAMRDAYGYAVRRGEWLTVADLIGGPAEPYPVPDPAPSITRARATARAKAALSPPASRADGSAPDPVAERRATVARLRELAAVRPDVHLGPLSWALQDLSDDLADQRRSGEAMAAADDAVDAAEELCERTGTGPDLLAAWAAHTLGRRLREAGRGEDAAALFAEAVETVREAFRHDPCRRAEMSGMTVDYATELLKLGRAEEALATADDVLAQLDAAERDGAGQFSVQRALARRLRDAALDATGGGESADPAPET